MIAVDSSTKKTGIAYYKNGNLFTYDLIDYSKEKNMDIRFKNMSLGLIKTLEEFKPEIIYIEDTVVLRNAQTQRFLTRLQGVVYAWCVMNNCEFNTIRPTEWRKLIGHKQGKNIGRDELKQQAISYVFKTYSIDVADDVADAICIGDAVLKKYKIEK